MLPHIFSLEDLIMAIVQEQHINGITVRIHDDFYRDMTDEMILQILERIAARAQADLTLGETNPPTLRRNDR